MPMTNSVKDFKLQFFYARLVNAAGKREVAELDEKGVAIKSKFLWSWTHTHFKYDGPSRHVSPTVSPGKMLEL